MRYVINADDFGGYDNVNKKIVFLLKNNFISQTTIMLTCGKCSLSAIDMAKQNNLFEKVGLHVSLTHGHPMSESIKTTPFSSDNWLLNTYLRKKIHYIFMPLKYKKAIKDEINMQMSSYIKNGFTLKHFDSHGNIHFYPSFYKIFIQCAVKNGFESVRLPYFNKSRNPLSNFMKRKIIKAYKRHFKTVEAGTLTLEDALSLRCCSGSFEIMVHPQDGNIKEDNKILECIEKYGKPIDYSILQ